MPAAMPANIAYCFLSRLERMRAALASSIELMRLSEEERFFIANKEEMQHIVPESGCLVKTPFEIHTKKPRFSGYRCVMALSWHRPTLAERMLYYHRRWRA
jgi:hypothetical protein